MGNVGDLKSDFSSVIRSSDIKSAIRSRASAAEFGDRLMLPATWQLGRLDVTESSRNAALPHSLNSQLRGA
jgi:hypothetical protein